MKRLFVPLLCILCASLNAQTVLKGVIANAQGAGEKSINAFVVDNEGTCVTVGLVGTDINQVKLFIDKAVVPVKAVVQDSVSRLAVLTIPAEYLGNLTPYTLSSSQSLHGGAMANVGGSTGAKTAVAGWENKFGGNLLPLGLLRMNYVNDFPNPGTPIVDDKGALIAISHQGIVAPGTASGYALPVEVLKRVQHGFEKSGIVARSWVGVILEVNNSLPLIESVRPDSPAAVAGIRKGDVLLGVDGRKISNYSDAVDAFYYLTENREATFHLLRGIKTMQLTVTPKMQPVIQQAIDKK